MAAKAQGDRQELETHLYGGDETYGRESEAQLQRADFVPPERDGAWGDAPDRNQWAGMSNTQNQATARQGWTSKERSSFILMWIATGLAWWEVVFVIMCHADKTISVCSTYFSGWLWIIGLLCTFAFYIWITLKYNPCLPYLNQPIIGQSLDDITEKARETAPSLWWVTRSYPVHINPRSDIAASHVVHQARSYFFYDQWWDVTPQVLTTASEKPTRLRTSRGFTFADHETKNTYDVQMESFIQMNSRTPNTDFDCGIEVPNFPQGECLVSVDPLGSFFTKQTMWIMHFVLLGLVYRHLFYLWTASTELNNFKLLKKRPPPAMVQAQRQMQQQQQLMMQQQQQMGMQQMYVAPVVAQPGYQPVLQPLPPQNRQHQQQQQYHPPAPAFF